MLINSIKINTEVIILNEVEAKIGNISNILLTTAAPTGTRAAPQSFSVFLVYVCDCCNVKHSSLRAVICRNMTCLKKNPKNLKQSRKIFSKDTCKIFLVLQITAIDVFTLTFVQALPLTFSSEYLYLFLIHNSVGSSVADDLKVHHALRSLEVQI